VFDKRSENVKTVLCKHSQSLKAYKLSENSHQTIVNILIFIREATGPN